MIDLRVVYRRAEEHTKLFVGGLFCLLVLFIFLQSIFSAGMVLAGLVSIVALFVAFTRPLWILGFLALYLPFESIVLKFTPNDVYVLVRYFSEGLIYLVAGVVLVQFFLGKRTYQPFFLDTPMVLLLVSIVASVVINFVPASVALLGIRQIIRFALVFFLIVQLKPSASFVRLLTTALFGIVLFQSILGMTQSLVGQPLDQFLLPAEKHTLGSITLTEGVDQFWDPGSRIFGTLGRYDRLGNFLYVFLLLGAGFLFTKQRSNQFASLLPWLFLLGLPALVLTYSRASWFAFLLGFLFIGLWIKRDRRVATGLVGFVVALFVIFLTSGLRISLLTEGSGQTLSERFFESFSYARWAGEYYGLGRTFWFVHTPLDVVSRAPLFGWGPGQYGGGAAAALRNTTVYEKTGLPFGVFGTEGYIDNNWFSLWAEIGTLGMVFYLWIIFGLFFFALRTYKASKDPFVQALCLGFSALVIAVVFNAFTSTILEIRTIAYYFWLYAGFIVVLGQNKRDATV